MNLSVQQVWPQVDDLRYTYDPAGNLTRVVNTQGHPGNGAPTRTECFTYDPLDRLSQAWTATDNCAAAPSTATVGGPTPYWTNWTFDQIGLRKTQVQHALPGASGGDTTTSYTYPASGAGAVRPHALSSTSMTGPAGTSLTSYGYNAVGDTTTRTLPAGNQTLSWNEHNRLGAVTTPAGTTSYLYDADGTQLIRRDPGSTTLYLPGEEITRDNVTGTVTGTRYYTHNGTVVALRVGGANISYLQADQHGTTQVAVKAEAIDNHTVTRRTFDPYGNPLGTGLGAWPDAHGFLNKPHNPTTNLTDIGARTYDPTTGRFISVDPLLDLANPQSWTGYTYAGNNPTTFSDPTGLKYFVDDNNASIPRLQGATTPGREGISTADRASQRARTNAHVGAKSKIKYSDLLKSGVDADDSVNSGLKRFGAFATEASRMLREGLTPGGIYMSLLRRNDVLRELSKFFRSSFFKNAARSITLFGVALSYMDHRAEGDREVTAALKAAFETAASMAGGLAGGTIGAAVGSAVAPGPGTANRGCNRRGGRRVCRKLGWWTDHGCGRPGIHFGGGYHPRCGSQHGRGSGPHNQERC